MDIKDFELLVSLNVFNESLMNDAVYKFKRYEDASLIYTGIDRHIDENVGLYSTVISRDDYDVMAGQLVSSMVANPTAEDDVPVTPVFKSIGGISYEEDEDERVPKTARKKSVHHANRTPNVGGQNRSGSTYRPSYIPPTPVANSATKKPLVSIDTSKVNVGTIVSHKAFGGGQVKGIDGGKVVVAFNGKDKTFQFPGAFEQGFLKLDETKTQ